MYVLKLIFKNLNVLCVKAKHRAWSSRGWIEALLHLSQLPAREAVINCLPSGGEMNIIKIATRENFMKN